MSLLTAQFPEPGKVPTSWGMPSKKVTAPGGLFILSVGLRFFGKPRSAVMPPAHTKRGARAQHKTARASPSLCPSPLREAPSHTSDKIKPSWRLWNLCPERFKEGFLESPGKKTSRVVFAPMECHLPCFINILNFQCRKISINIHSPSYLFETHSSMLPSFECLC